MTRWIYSLTLLIAITACNENAEKINTDSPGSTQQKPVLTQPAKPSSTVKKPFNLNQVKQQYAGITLSILDASLQNYQDPPALSLSLSVPLNPAHNHQAHLQVMNDEEQLIDGAWQLSDNGRQLYFTAIEAETNYHIKV
ncbi:MAG: hypothetical protein KAU21_08290, partial [Gammaproteobacteria bacterium]|nr:hypothetical protein [Gammaproteobacteria bacterium]